jgi:hypothetical protein
MKLRYFAEIRCVTGETSALIFEADDRERFTLTVKRFEDACERLKAQPLQLFCHSAWERALLEPFSVDLSRTH